MTRLFRVGAKPLVFIVRRAWDIKAALDLLHILWEVTAISTVSTEDDRVASILQ